MSRTSFCLTESFPRRQMTINIKAFRERRRKELKLIQEYREATSRTLLEPNLKHTCIQLLYMESWHGDFTYNFKYFFVYYDWFDLGIIIFHGALIHVSFYIRNLLTINKVITNSFATVSLSKEKYKQKMNNGDKIAIFTWCRGAI